jgi:hypothetical protein
MTEQFDPEKFVAAPAERGHRGSERLRRLSIQEPDHRHHRLLRARRERPRCRRSAEQRDELAPLYPNHVIPRACAVWVRLKRTLAALAHFARCLGCRPSERS